MRSEIKNISCIKSLTCYSLLMIAGAFVGCKQQDNKTVALPDTIPIEKIDTAIPVITTYDPAEAIIHTGNVSVNALLNFAKSLQGIPYKYGSTDPKAGFDCSGFISYVFNHFNITVPRSSVDFTNVHTEIPLQDAKPGDLVLFTGTDSAIRVVGHMGIIVTANNDEYEFIHSTSGKAFGVTITPLNNYYMGRFMKILRIFPENN